STSIRSIGSTPTSTRPSATITASTTDLTIAASTTALAMVSITIGIGTTGPTASAASGIHSATMDCSTIASGPRTISITPGGAPIIGGAISRGGTGMAHRLGPGSAAG